MSVTAEILAQGKRAGVMIACAESCTGGMLAAALTDLPGASAVFERGFVSYTNTAKTEMLGVATATIATYGAVSEPVALEMAHGALTRSCAALAVSITGIAGPGGSEHKPEGRVCFGLAQDTGTQTETVEFGALGRAAVRKAARDHALGLLQGALAKLPDK